MGTKIEAGRQSRVVRQEILHLEDADHVVQASLVHGHPVVQVARMAGRSRSGGVAESIPKTSVRGTMISATVVSPSSKTPWIISRSLRWTTPS